LTKVNAVVAKCRNLPAKLPGALSWRN